MRIFHLHCCILLLNVGETADLLDEESQQQVLEVTDCSPEFEAPQRTRTNKTWQSVPSSEIEQSELPMILEPAPKRNQRSRRRKSSKSPPENKSLKKKKRDS